MKTERNFVIHDLKSAPEPSKEALQWYQSNFQIVPNLAGVIAESPALILSYWQLQNNLLAHGELSRQESNIVQMSVAHANRCQYCVAGHHAFGMTPFYGNSAEQLEAIRKDLEFDNPKHNALRDFTLLILDKKGRISNAQLQHFLDAGYSRSQALEVVANIAAKVMSNFSNQIVLTPVDDAFLALTEGLPYKEDRKTI